MSFAHVALWPVCYHWQINQLGKQSPVSVLLLMALSKCLSFRVLMRTCCIHAPGLSAVCDMTPNPIIEDGLWKLPHHHHKLISSNSLTSYCGRHGLVCSVLRVYSKPVFIFSVFSYLQHVTLCAAPGPPYHQSLLHLVLQKSL